MKTGDQVRFNMSAFHRPPAWCLGATHGCSARTGTVTRIRAVRNMLSLIVTQCDRCRLENTWEAAQLAPVTHLIEGL